MEKMIEQLETEFHQSLNVPFEDYQWAIREILSLRNQNRNVTLNVGEGDSSKFLQLRVIDLEKKLSIDRKKVSELEIELAKIKKDRDFYRTQYEKENKQYTEVSQK
jgi:predicted RNase H-like nuclease (RuvC/YqgF family)